MGYTCGGLGMHGQGIVAPIEFVMILMRVILGYETSSPYASHPLICIGPRTLNHPLMLFQILSQSPLMILLLLSKNHILHLLFSKNRILRHQHLNRISALTNLTKGIDLCHQHLNRINTLTSLTKGIHLCIEISLGRVAALLSDH
jgi:hypothetical protein